MYDNADKYVRERLDQYSGWYDGKSVAMKRIYLRFRAVTGVGGVLIPVAVNIESLPYKDAIVTVVGIIVAVLITLEGVFHWGDQWKNFRSTEQLLGREKVFFYTRRGPYRGLSEEDAFGLLIERCEEAIAVENTATLNVLSIQQSNPQDKKTGT
jgi:hypothetical protein